MRVVSTRGRAIIAMIALYGVSAPPTGGGPFSAWWAFSHHPSGGEAAFGMTAASGASPWTASVVAGILAVAVTAGFFWRHRQRQGIACAIGGAVLVFVAPMLYRIGPPHWAPGALWPGGLSPSGIIGLGIALGACFTTTVRPGRLSVKVAVAVAGILWLVVVFGAWNPVLTTPTSSGLSSQSVPVKMFLTTLLAWVPLAFSAVWLVSRAWMRQEAAVATVDADSGSFLRRSATISRRLRHQIPPAR